MKHISEILGSILLFEFERGIVEGEKRVRDSVDPWMLEKKTEIGLRQIISDVLAGVSHDDIIRNWDNNRR